MGMNIVGLDLEPYLKGLPQLPTKAIVLGRDGSSKGELELPPQFMTPIRLDVIRRAYLSAFTASLQPKGADPMAGKRTTAKAFGVGLGIARVPRATGSLWPRARLATNVVKGRSAHAPTTEKIIHERINKKERDLAIRSAIAATAVKELVQRRGHNISGIKELPLVVADIESIEKARDAKAMLESIGAWRDVERASAGVRDRAGIGKLRGRRYKEPKSVLIVVSTPRSPLARAARNFPGVDVVYVNNLSVLYLAPGGVPGRLTLWSDAAIKALQERGLFMR
jgi:large subunit ribosomal protein L4e